MDRGVWPLADLEIRQRRGGRGREIRGSFRYGVSATMRDRGRVRKERISAGAFRFAIEKEDREINLLVGHSFDRPLASKLDGSLELSDSSQALSFRALLPPEGEQPTYMRDSVLMLNAGLVGGISPGFVVPPADVVPNAERLVPEPGNADVLIREVSDAVLYELSLVTRPAYPRTEVESRADRARRVEIWL